MTTLEEKVIAQLQLIDEDFRVKKYLLAASGGSDSSCLIGVFRQLGLCFEVAHCNFKLRGEESDGDELFVKETISQLGSKGHFAQFNTAKIAEKNKTSIQEEARRLRYNWFQELLKENDFDFIVTGHHQDDLIETFFINTVRGSGVKGLRSIPVQNGNVIRPLLTSTKEEVEAYLSVNNICFRHDSSNDSLKYSRNYLRHKIIPGLESVHPNAKKGIIRTINNLANTEQYLIQKLEEDKSRIIDKDGEVVNIKIGKSTPVFLLYNIVSEYGFNSTQLDNLLDVERRGAVFYSSSFVMLKEENSIVISPINNKEEEVFVFKNVGTFNTPFNISFFEENLKDLEFKKNIAYFDADKIKFPFILRKWNNGDRFVPFGMKGGKKISDYFIDLKLNKIEKEQVWVLESNNKICWVVGKRTDERFKVTKSTTKIIKIVTK